MYRITTLIALSLVVTSMSLAGQGDKDKGTSHTSSNTQSNRGYSNNRPTPPPARPAPTATSRQAPTPPPAATQAPRNSGFNYHSTQSGPAYSGRPAPTGTTFSGRTSQSGSDFSGRTNSPSANQPARTSTQNWWLGNNQRPSQPTLNPIYNAGGNQQGLPLTTYGSQRTNQPGNNGRSTGYANQGYGQQGRDGGSRLNDGNRTGAGRGGHNYERAPEHVNPVRIHEFPGDPGRHQWEHRWDRDGDRGGYWGNDLFVFDGGLSFRMGYVTCGFWGPSHYWYYPNYCYAPGPMYLVSPWYCYPELPPYINADVVVTGGYFNEPMAWQPYDYSYPGDSDWSTGYGTQDSYGGRSPLDHSIDVLVGGFASNSIQTADDALPRSGLVAIKEGGLYKYSVNAKDFYNMFADVINSTKTQGYHILSVGIGGGFARVVARQDRLDAWGQRASVYHEFYLEPEGNGYVVRRFGTYTSRPF